MNSGRDAGAVCREGVTVRSITGSLGRFVVETDQGPVRARVVVGAFGRRSGLDTALGRRTSLIESPYVAYKQHYMHPEFPARIEVHAFEGGYCGVSPVEDGRVNVCFIAHKRLLAQAGGRLDRLIAESLFTNPRLRARVSSMRPVPGTLRAVSRPSLAARGKFDRDICMAGDAAGMIAPLCGDGMAMALRGASLATRLLDGFLCGKLSAGKVKLLYESAWNDSFAARLAIGRLAHAVAFSPSLADLAVGQCNAHPRLGQWLVEHTRG
jgi:flavin-dependent dehydrogenase